MSSPKWAFWISRRGCWMAGVAIARSHFGLDIWPQNSYADFCFIEGDAPMAVGCNPGWRRKRRLFAKQRQPRKPAAEPAKAPQRPVSQFTSPPLRLRLAGKV